MNLTDEPISPSLTTRLLGHAFRCWQFVVRTVVPFSARLLLCGCLGIAVTDSLAQDYKTPTVTDLYGAPRQLNSGAGKEGALDVPMQGGERSSTQYPTLRMNNLSTRVSVEAAPQKRPPAQTVPPVGEMSEFEVMVRQSLGVALPVYARNLFQSQDAPFNVGDQVNVPADFVIGPGDDIIIRAWGSIELEYAVTVDRQGSVFIPKLGSLQLAGLTYKELQPAIHQALSRIYKRFELSVTMGSLRSLRVYVTGHARAPGTYQINALSSLISALFITGGASATGDLRNIELRRGSEVIGRLDLYDFIMNGNRSADLRLQNEDVIHIPPMAGQVAVAGSVRSSAIYQIKPGMTLGGLLQLSGGTTAAADGLRITLERVSRLDASAAGATKNRLGRTIEELDFGPAAMQTPLRDGDLAIVVPISPQFNNAVTLKGQVALPLRYAWRDGLRVSDIIPSLDALISPAYWVEKNSQARIASFLTDPANVQAHPTFPEINWEYAVIERVLSQSLQVTLIPFQLGRAVFDRDPQHDPLLKPGDTITVFSRKDFRGPLEQSSRFVRVEGEVQRPGLYPVEPGETLPMLIQRAGGLTPLGYLYGTHLVRESVRQQQRRRMDDYINMMERDFARHLIERSRDVSGKDEAEALPQESRAVSEFIQNMRKMQPEGRMHLELSSSVREVTQLPSLRLENGDSILVPPIPETVDVVGSVVAERTFLWQKGRDAEHYIQLAGGRRPSARSNALVIRPDGTLADVSRLRDSDMVPGDTILVEEDTERVSWTRRLKDIGQIVYQFGLGAAGARVVQGM